MKVAIQRRAMVEKNRLKEKQADIPEHLQKKKAEKLAEERKGVEKELAELKKEAAKAAAGDLVSQAR